MEKAKRRQMVGLWMIAALLLAAVGAFWVVKRGVGETKANVEKVGGDVLGVGNKVDAVQSGVSDISTTLKGPTGVNGRLIVQSDPPGATAFLPHEHSMSLPLRMDTPRGTYSFSFNLLGYEPEFREVTIQSGEVTDLGTIHLKPLQKQFDADATYRIDQVSADPYTFLDRDIWVRAKINEDPTHLDLMTAGEWMRYHYFGLMGVGGAPAKLGASILPMGNAWAIGRMMPDGAEKFQAALVKEHNNIIRRDTAKNERLLQTLNPAQREYFRPKQHAGAANTEGRVRIRVESRTYSPGGLRHEIEEYKFLCDIQDWDFTEIDKEADAETAAYVARGTSSQPEISGGSGPGQAHVDNGSDASPPSVGGAPATPPEPGVASSVPAPSGGPPVDLVADARAAQQELDVACLEARDCIRTLGPEANDRLTNSQTHWLAALGRITDPAQRTAFVRQRTAQLRQQTATFNRKMKEYDDAHRGQ